ncbi:hypothetical protein VIGAN_01456200 [Vigna angularis var. angularis]|uniref:dCTP pyrophosphatase 1 n=1 Tax=Vigna angularis var. angularis TaxID=157739 RepID=A0A0S3R7U9_PHAAN|nr:hypothetical protein VIGAN_01456200 [Vigna angularis var. angularis]
MLSINWTCTQHYWINQTNKHKPFLQKMEYSNGFPRKRDVSLQELSKRLAEFAQVRGWEQYHSPRNLLLALVGEVGELSEIFQWKGEVAKGLPNWSSDDKEHLEEELSDVLLYLVRLADVCGLDLGQAALTKIVKNAKKYPVTTTDHTTTSNRN